MSGQLGDGVTHPGDRTRLAYAGSCLLLGEAWPHPLAWHCLSGPLFPAAHPHLGERGTESLKTQNIESAKPAFALISCADKIPNPSASVSPPGKWARDHFLGLLLGGMLPVLGTG